MVEDGKIVYKVVLDDEGVENDAASAGDRAGEAFAKSTSSKLGTAAKAVGSAALAVGTAAVAAGSAVVKATGDLAEYGDHIDKMSQKLGMSAEAYQEWDAILQHSGASIDSLEPTMKSLFTAAQKGSEAFDALGMSTEQVASMSQEDLFAATISALQGVEDETTRTALAQELLGRGAQELGALLNTSAEDTEEMRQRVHELGGVMSDEAVKSAAQYQDTLQDMQTAMQGVGRELISEFLPSITGVMEGITAIFSGDTEGGVGMITQGLNDMLNGIVEKIPEIIEIGSEIVFGLLEGLFNSIPQLFETGIVLLEKLLSGIGQASSQIIPAAFSIIKTLILGLIKHLPDIILTGIDLLFGIIQGLVDAIPDLVSMLPEIIDALTNGLLARLPEIISAGIQLIIALGRGLIQAIPQLIAMLPQVITSIINVFRNTDWLSIGANIVNGVWEGIKSLWSTLVSALRDSVTQLWQNAKAALGIASPSKKFKYIGEMTTEGTIEGIEDTEAEMTRTVRDIYSGVTDTAQAALQPVSYGGAAREEIEQQVSYTLQATGTTGETMIVVPLSIDGREIARATAWSMGEQLAWEEM